MLLQNSCFIRYLSYGCTRTKEVETDNVFHFFVRLIDHDVFAIVKALTPSFRWLKKKFITLWRAHFLHRSLSAVRLQNMWMPPQFHCLIASTINWGKWRLWTKHICPNHRRWAYFDQGWTFYFPAKKISAAWQFALCIKEATNGKLAGL